jgi:hypothetical protein
MMPRSAGVALLLVLAGCATGNEALPSDGSSPSAEGFVVIDGGGIEGYLWPDLGAPPDAFIWPADLPIHDAWPTADLLPPDGPTPDAHIPCPDPYEPNESCTAGKSLGTISEGSSWLTKTATLDPGTDVDWYTATGEEDSHTCLPLTSQCYYFKARLQVPAGRHLKLCVVQDYCSASSSCADNAGTPGPQQLDVQYKVSGTCALNDDTDAKIQVQQLDGQGGCQSYTLSINYDEC